MERRPQVPFALLFPGGSIVPDGVVEDDEADHHLGLFIRVRGYQRTVTNYSCFRTVLSPCSRPGKEKIPIAVTRPLRRGDIINLDEARYKYVRPARRLTDD